MAHGSEGRGSHSPWWTKYSRKVLTSELRPAWYGCCRRPVGIQTRGGWLVESGKQGRWEGLGWHIALETEMNREVNRGGWGWQGWGGRAPRARRPFPRREPGRRQAERRAEADLALVPGASEAHRVPEETGPLQALLRTSVTVGEAGLSGPRLCSHPHNVEMDLPRGAPAGMRTNSAKKPHYPRSPGPQLATRSRLSPRESPPWKWRLPAGLKRVP